MTSLSKMKTINYIDSVRLPYVVVAALTERVQSILRSDLGWPTKVTIHSLRFWVFVTGGLVSKPAGQLTPSSSPCQKRNDDGGTTSGTRSSALTPTAMQ